MTDRIDKFSGLASSVNLLTKSGLSPGVLGPLKSGLCTGNHRFFTVDLLDQSKLKNGGRVCENYQGSLNRTNCEVELNHDLENLRFRINSRKVSRLPARVSNRVLDRQEATGNGNGSGELVQAQRDTAAYAVFRDTKEQVTLYLEMTVKEAWPLSVQELDSEEESFNLESIALQEIKSHKESIPNFKNMSKTVFLDHCNKEKYDSKAIEILIKTDLRNCRTDILKHCEENFKELSKNSLGCKVLKSAVCYSHRLAQIIILYYQSSFSSLLSDENTIEVMKALVSISEKFRLTVLTWFKGSITIALKKKSITKLISAAIKSAKTEQEVCFMKDLIFSPQSPNLNEQRNLLLLVASFSEIAKTAELDEIFKHFIDCVDLSETLNCKYKFLLIYTMIKKSHQLSLGMLMANTSSRLSALYSTAYFKQLMIGISNLPFFSLVKQQLLLSLVSNKENMSEAVRDDASLYFFVHLLTSLLDANQADLIFAIRQRLQDPSILRGLMTALRKTLLSSN